ncbi:MAG TPA: cyclodeaminase/cyclohydrolase family protein, partial [Atopostipes sp.]|nr:cyclodeaminase/cyclohydrolase family protein [Atopostipes sp.]
MKNKTVIEWTKELASKDGKYGGGSAASVVGAFAASLAQFVFELQAGKEKYADHEEQIQAAIRKAEVFTEELLDLAEIDADAFEPVLNLFKLPKDTAEEKAYRREKIDQGLEEAAKPPQDILKKMDQVLDLFEELLELKVRGTIVDDIAVGLFFTEATVESAKINCMVNIKLIKNEDQKMKLTNEVEEVYAATLKRTRHLKDEALEILH